MYTILGAGLSGLTIADILDKKRVPFEIFEAKTHGGGHIYSEIKDGFTWDEGPHVSFTKYDQVKQYFAENSNDQLVEFAAKPANYFESLWIKHPAQAHMYALPESLRNACLRDVKAVREEFPKDYHAENYRQWIVYAFGNTFANTFPEVYTTKYWTTTPENLTTDWVGKRIYFPEIEDMIASASAPLAKQTHYIDLVRYPKQGGFYSFIKKTEDRLPVLYNHRLKAISFRNKELKFENGLIKKFDKLISTLPLPQLIANSDAPQEIKNAAKRLKCSQLLLINVVVTHPSPTAYHWIYVYDRDFYSTRINFTELLSPENGVPGKSGIQVEVYFSDYRPLTEDKEIVAEKVIGELITMGLVVSRSSVEAYHTKWIEYANVIFDTQRKEAQEIVLNWLAEQGLQREVDDMDPMSVWESKPRTRFGDIILAGRFAQWKYFWTDDCVMRANFIGDYINQTKV